MQVEGRTDREGSTHEWRFRLSNSVFSFVLCPLFHVYTIECLILRLSWLKRVYARRNSQKRVYKPRHRKNRVVSLLFRFIIFNRDAPLPHPHDIIQHTLLTLSGFNVKTWPVSWITMMLIQLSIVFANPQSNTDTRTEWHGLSWTESKARHTLFHGPHWYSHCFLFTLGSLNCTHGLCLEAHALGENGTGCLGVSNISFLQSWARCYSTLFLDREHTNNKCLDFARSVLWWCLDNLVYCRSDFFGFPWSSLPLLSGTIQR
jgi:hypothetical protein